MTPAILSSNEYLFVSTGVCSGWNRCDDLYWKEWDRVSYLKDHARDPGERAFWAGLNAGLQTGYQKCIERQV